MLRRRKSFDSLSYQWMAEFRDDGQVARTDAAGRMGAVWGGTLPGACRGYKAAHGLAAGVSAEFAASFRVRSFGITKLAEVHADSQDRSLMLLPLHENSRHAAQGGSGRSMDAEHSCSTAVRRTTASVRRGLREK